MSDGWTAAQHLTRRRVAEAAQQAHVQSTVILAYRRADAARAREEVRAYVAAIHRGDVRFDRRDDLTVADRPVLWTSDDHQGPRPTAQERWEQVRADRWLEVTLASVAPTVVPSAHRQEDP